ncbi:MAG TPA: DinB family protein [Saprospiraceae bacterium]|nr:DinB family protein [Saprospiraceae bacterium]HMU04897.1 DinB family protein [Saprospiraceae bacterium]
MVTQSINRLDTLINIIPDLLLNMDESDLTLKTSPEKWSKKEILGHLIDSAANNHQRFIRGQYEDVPTIFYDQNQWNNLSHYHGMNTNQIIAFWTMYNQHLLHIIKHITNDNLQKKCRAFDGYTYTLEFLINDYVAHLEHHLRQVVSY